MGIIMSNMFWGSCDTPTPANFVTVKFSTKLSFLSCLGTNSFLVLSCFIHENMCTNKDTVK